MLLFQNASFQKLYFLSALSLVISDLSSKFSVWECIVPVPSCTVQLLPQQGDTSCLFLLFFILVLSSSVLSFFCLFLPVLFSKSSFSNASFLCSCSFTVQLLPQQCDTSRLLLFLPVLSLVFPVLSSDCIVSVFLPVLSLVFPVPVLSSACRNRVTRLVSYWQYLQACPLERWQFPGRAFFPKI